MLYEGLGGSGDGSEREGDPRERKCAELTADSHPCRAETNTIL